MTEFNATEFFIYLIFPPMILILGLFGNITALKMLRMKAFKKFETSETYFYLFLMDTQYLIQIVTPYILYGYQIDLTIISDLGCKLYQYFNFALWSNNTRFWNN